MRRRLHPNHGRGTQLARRGCALPSRPPRRGAQACAASAAPTGAGPAAQSVCAEAASFDLPAAALAGAMEDVRAALEAALLRCEGGGQQVVAACAGPARPGALTAHARLMPHWPALVCLASVTGHSSVTRRTAWQEALA